MAKRIGTGASSQEDTRKSAAEATRKALEPLGDARATFGFVFASPEHDLGAATAEARNVSGCEDILGSSTAGELTEQGHLDGGLVVMLVAADDTSHRVEFAKGMKNDCKEIGRQFTYAAAETKKAARAAGRRHLTTILLTDGLAGTGEDLVREMFQQSPSVTQIVGGAAGDGGRFKTTVVAARGQSSSDAAAALHLFGPTPWGVGVGHGLRSTTKPVRVTRSQGNVIWTIEGLPAFEMYRRHALERGVILTHENAGPYLIANELGVHFFSSLSRARAPLSVGEEGSLNCAAAVPEGSFVSILEGEPAAMIDAARTAAEEARDRLGPGKAAGVLLFDCVCRGMILGDRFGEEIGAIRSVFGGDVPVAGFLTYGEIAQYPGRLEGWHNSTAVVVAIPG